MQQIYGPGKGQPDDDDICENASSKLSDLLAPLGFTPLDTFTKTKDSQPKDIRCQICKYTPIGTHFYTLMFFVVVYLDVRFLQVLGMMMMMMIWVEYDEYSDDYLCFYKSQFFLA